MADNWQSLVMPYRKGSVRALSRLISRVENREPGWMEVMKTLSPLKGQARTIGVTGSPGAGKSTLTNGLTRLLDEQGHKVGVIAVDPSSPFSGGSIMGDRVRMKDVWDSEDVYIRSMATRGALGGLNQSVRDVAKLLDGFGKDIIIIETVGVGQDEIDVVRAADIVLVVLVPGQGDSIQAIKAGIMEIADIFVINKADRDGADQVVLDVEAMLEMDQLQQRPRPPIMKTVANRGEGLSELVETTMSLIETTRRGDDWIEKRTREELIDLIEKELLGRLLAQWATDKRLEQIVRDIMNGRKDLYTVADSFLNQVNLDYTG